MNLVATVRAQVNALAIQGVIVGRRSVAMGNQLSTIESIVKTRFGDVEGILKGLSEKGSRRKQ